MLEIEKVREKFPSLNNCDNDGNNIIYLDGPGGTQVPSDVIEGISKIPAKAPIEDSDSMQVAEVFVAPFPSVAPSVATRFDAPESQVRHQLKGQNRRYSMEDIGQIEKRIGGMDTFHVEKGEEKNTYEITTKREITFSYLIRAKNEEDAMIRTLSFVSKDGSGQREDVKRPMYASKPIINVMAFKNK